MLANVGFGASIVAMNAYLPTLAAASPEVAALREELADLTSAAEDHEINDSIQEHEASNLENVHSAEEPLLHRLEREASALRKRHDIEFTNAASRISSRGVALGYGAGIILLLVALVPVTISHGSTFSLRLAIGLSGIWWALFSIPAAIWLPGATTTVSLDENPVWVEPSAGINKPETWSLQSQIVGAWKRLGGMLRWTEIKRLRNTFRYLAAWFLLSDGMSDLPLAKHRLTPFFDASQVSPPSPPPRSYSGKRRSTCHLPLSSSSASSRPSQASSAL